MRSLNRVTLIGRLASDVSLRQTKNGKIFSNFPVATSRFILKEGKKSEITDYHKIIAWGKLAEICNNYLTKGIALYLEGRLVNNSYESNSGEKHFKTEIFADNINILTSKKSKTGSRDIEVKPITEEIPVEESEFELVKIDK